MLKVEDSALTGQLVMMKSTDDKKKRRGVMEQRLSVPVDGRVDNVAVNTAQEWHIPHRTLVYTFIPEHPSACMHLL